MASRASDTGSQLTTTILCRVGTGENLHGLPTETTSRRIGNDEVGPSRLPLLDLRAGDDGTAIAEVDHGVGTGCLTRFDHDHPPPTQRGTEQSHAAVRVDDGVSVGKLAAGLADGRHQQFGRQGSRLEERSRADAQGLTGHHLVHRCRRPDFDVSGQAEQLDVALDDPCRTLSRGNADTEADLTASTNSDSGKHLLQQRVADWTVVKFDDVV